MYLRLVTGEDIIAEIEEKDEDFLFLHNPLKLVYMPNPKSPGMWSISMMQWIFNKIAKEQKFPISYRDILTIAEPSPYVIGYYNETVAHFTGNPVKQIDTKAILSELEKMAQELFGKEEEEPEVTEEMEKDAEDFVKNFFENMSSNNKGTLH
jgi:hypothetical protein